MVLVLLAGLIGRATAASLKVSPARFIIHDVVPGIEYDVYKETGLRITLYNDDKAARTWVLSVHRPSERGQWERGYAEIPDAGWCWFDRNEVSVEAEGKAYAHLFLKVPQEEKYNNQHWVVTLGIDGKPGAGGISLAADVRVQIETESVAGVEQRPYGILGISPSVIEFEDVVVGAVENGRVAIYNNDEEPHTYSVRPLFDDKSVDQKVYLTHSYRAVPDPLWISLPQAFDIQPGGVGIADLHVELPDDSALPGSQWESILLIVPDEGLPGFVRVRVATKEPPKTE